MLDYKEYIYEIYREQSFSRAAAKLYVSQPWLSSVVKKVEQELKTPLFDRTTSPISLTPAGRYYIEQVEKVMAIEKEMRQYFSELAEAGRTELHIGSSMFFCTYVLPRLLEEFRAMYPQITLTFTEGGSRELLLAVPAKFPVNHGLEAYRYTFQELLERHEQGKRKKPVPLKAFKDEPFLLLNQENDSYRRSMAFCRRAGFEPKVSAFLSQMMTAYYLVCEGAGVT